MMPVSQRLAPSTAPPPAQTSGVLSAGGGAEGRVRQGISGRYIAPRPAAIKRGRVTTRNRGALELYLIWLIYKPARLAHPPAIATIGRPPAMTRNIGGIDRVLRIILGLALISQVFVGLETPWGWLGMVPLLTALAGWCPPYAMLGISTCRRA